MLHHGCYLVTKYLVCFQIWSSPHVKVYVKFRFCFNERLICSVVIWFQSNLNLTLDLPQIIIKKLPVFLESSNLKFVKKFSIPQESLSVKNLKTKTLYILDPLTQHANADLANKASSQISFLRKNLITQKGLQLEVFKKCFKKAFLKGNKLYFKWLFLRNSV